MHVQIGKKMFNMEWKLAIWSKITREKIHYVVQPILHVGDIRELTKNCVST